MNNNIILLFLCLFINSFTLARLNKAINYSSKHNIGYSKSNDLSFYNSQDIKWSSIDTLIIPQGISNASQIIKTAQSKNVNGVINVIGNSLDDSGISSVVQQVIALDSDGVSLYFYSNPADGNYLNKISKLGTQLKSISSNIQFTVSISISNSPYSNIDISSLPVVDYLIANAYDIGSFIGSVQSHSPTNQVRNEINKWFNNSNINKNKIILSVPWYGYQYKCDKYPYGLFTQNCVASKYPIQIEFNKVYKYLNGIEITNLLYATSTEIWNQTSSNPYINIRILIGTSYSNAYPDEINQIQYDNPKSTYLKIKGTNVGGVAIYSLDSLYGLPQNIINAMYLSIDKSFITL